jgi:hypothetical protein
VVLPSGERYWTVLDEQPLGINHTQLRRDRILD